jgi:hypothetical protein
MIAGQQTVDILSQMMANSIKSGERIMAEKKEFYLTITKEQFDSIHKTWLDDPEVKATKQHIKNYSWDKWIYTAYSKKYKQDDVLFPGLVHPPHEAYRAKKPLQLAELMELAKHQTRPPYRVYSYSLIFPNLDYHYGGRKDAYAKKYESIILRHMPKWLNVVYRKRVKGE